jgi:hypothetical protein
MCGGIQYQDQKSTFPTPVPHYRQGYGMAE